MVRPQPRILLMYISEVSGHHSAALAIESAIRTIAPVAEILNINAFRYTNPISEGMINHLYMEIIRNFPFIWRYLYDNPAVAKGIEKVRRVVHKFNLPKLKQLFDTFRPEVVACTQAFPCGMVADFKKYYQSSIPLVAVLTDYIPHTYWIDDNVDYYITPAQEVSAVLQQKGVAAQQIKSLGIPFDLKFNVGLCREAILSSLGLNLAIPVVLIMGGGQGLGPIQEIVASFQRADKAYQLIIVTGTNTRLYNFFYPKLGAYKHKTVLYGYTKIIPELMSISDIIVTKPGGITAAEALAKQLPMVIIRPIPGQEASNTAYLIRQGAAVKINDPSKVASVVEDILVVPGKLACMRQAALAISKPNSSLDIARLILGLCPGVHV